MLQIVDADAITDVDVTMDADVITDVDVTTDADVTTDVVSPMASSAATTADAALSGFCFCYPAAADAAITNLVSTTAVAMTTAC